jgi:hypothetical protein
MRKKYIPAQMEVLTIESSMIMIPGTGPEDPHPAPQRIWLED